MTDRSEDLKNQLLDAALPHVVFDGWTADAFNAAIAETGAEPALAKALCPRGAVDLAKAFHQRGDAQMVQGLAAADMASLRFRDRIALAVKLRLQAVADHKEEVRRGSTLFALPHLAGEGAKLLWGTADAIWTALGDSSDDFNWYSKRATLSGVYGATVLFWLGDDSEGAEATWAFLDRRIEDVMRIESAKKTVRNSPVLSRLMAGPNWVLGQVKAPNAARRSEFPGAWTKPPTSTDA